MYLYSKLISMNEVQFCAASLLYGSYGAKFCTYHADMYKEAGANIYIYSEDDKQLNITKPFIATKYCEIITHSNKYISRSIITG